MITFRWRDTILTEETSWKVFWNTRSASDQAEANLTLAGSIEDAMERAAHFIKLGFFVLGVKAPSSAEMTENDVADRFKHILPTAVETGLQ